ncbi:MAG: GFA family protein [Magnetovibrionaceae bacterium]
MAKPVTGSCLCGGVRYEIKAFMKDVVACHCSQCRKTSGHHVAATKALNSDMAFQSDETLVWYASSDEAERGFCGTCGSNLFWRVKGAEATSVFAGPLDAPTGLAMTRHIYVDDKGDYYDLPNDHEQFPQSD